MMFNESKKIVLICIVSLLMLFLLGCASISTNESDRNVLSLPNWYWINWHNNDYGQILIPVNIPTKNINNTSSISEQGTIFLKGFSVSIKPAIINNCESFQANNKDIILNNSVKDEIYLKYLGENEVQCEENWKLLRIDSDIKSSFTNYLLERYVNHKPENFIRYIDTPSKGENILSLNIEKDNIPLLQYFTDVVNYQGIGYILKKDGHYIFSKAVMCNVLDNYILFAEFNYTFKDDISENTLSNYFSLITEYVQVRISFHLDAMNSIKK